MKPEKYFENISSVARKYESIKAFFKEKMTAEKVALKFADYNGFRGGSNLLSLLHHKIILIDQITIY